MECAYTGTDGLSFGMSDTFDAVILDLGLPQMHGVDVRITRSWRARLDSNQRPLA